MHRRTVMHVLLAAGVAVIVTLGHAAGGTARTDRSAGLGTLPLQASAARSLVAELRRSAPARERAALADGTVTEQEYRRASQDALACTTSHLVALARAAGVEPPAPPGPVAASPDGFRVTYQYSVPVQLAAQASDVDRACRAGSVDAVELGFQASVLADHPRVAAAVATFASCLAAHDVHLPDAVEPNTTRLALRALGRDVAASRRAAPCLAASPIVTAAPTESLQHERGR